MKSGGERYEDIMTTDVQADQGLTVEAVGQVRHVHAVQATVRQLQASQWSVEGTRHTNQVKGKNRVIDKRPLLPAVRAAFARRFNMKLCKT